MIIKRLCLILLLFIMLSGMNATTKHTHRERKRMRRRQEAHIHFQPDSVLKETKQSSKISSSLSGSILLPSSKHYKFVEKIEPKGKAVAWGYLNNRQSESGWSELTIHTSSIFSDMEQSFALGYLEGVLTHEYIWLFNKFVSSRHQHSSLTDFFEKQNDYLRKKISEVDTTANSEEGEYWYHVALALAQIDGMVEGYNSRAPSDRKLTLMDLWLINSDGDIMDLERALTPGRKFKKADDMSRIELIELMSFHGRCSALLKFTGDDLLAAHTTWDDYSEMYRIYKHYDMELHHHAVKSSSISFTSYPGLITSTDDFIVLSPSKLFVMETTINILNEELYQKVDPTDTVMSWIRLIVSNRLSDTAKQWVHLFSLYNSGTYNDQWLVVDYKLFEPGMKELRSNTVWLLEQIPGYVHRKDISNLISKKTYFASFNRPYFQAIQDRAMKQKNNIDNHKEINQQEDFFTYHNCPRAKIFAREQKDIHDIKDMKRVIQFNDWEHDELSLGCPGFAPAARFDFVGKNCKEMIKMPRASGAIDGKVFSSTWISHRKTQVRAGPTHDDQLIFIWSKSPFTSEFHEKQPDKWDFEWQTMIPHKFILPEEIEES